MFLGKISEGLRKKPNNGGFDPKWTIELNTATFGIPDLDFVPIRLADL